MTLDFDKYMKLGEWTISCDFPDITQRRAMITLRGLMPDSKRPAHCLYSSVNIGLNEKHRGVSLDELKARKTEKELIPKLKSYIAERLDIGCFSISKAIVGEINFGDWEMSAKDAEKINKHYRAMSKKEDDQDFFIPVTEIEAYNLITSEWDLI